MTASTDLHTLTGAYALDALDEDERVAFEQHLAKCEDCAQEVRELTATAGRLALAATMPPPPRLKTQVMEQIAGVRQEHSHSGVTALSRTARRERAMRWALAACVAAAAGLGGTTLWQHQQADEARQQAQVAQRQADQITEVLSAPDAKVTSTAVGGAARGSVVVSHDSDKAVFVASGLAKPPQGKVYQLWFADGDRMRPAGLMDPSRTSQSVLMAGAVGKASGVGVTLEPDAGSKQPTTQPVVLLQLPA
ncbi:anti-sigma factor domain-containing protein [Streptomyces sp. VRA16 Mangrove soil]|uniref:anti-sigma factor n=1 Tax=Streptomyces sp. VRA16 Mangrove soil TaxID=2817434 RepID=UPI001A9F74F5|nr:anti-sigma factor [Streptomyces sp. VRA16 Mangrove soil]MBO1332590.1 anti-sigma factor [Streptomyces sp. VRA16 Mangrove soil]